LETDADRDPDWEEMNRDEDHFLRMEGLVAFQDVDDVVIGVAVVAAGRDDIVAVAVVDVVAGDATDVANEIDCEGGGRTNLSLPLLRVLASCCCC
jgi:hypothetical protein